MDLGQLEMFVAAAESRSVQRASERVFRTQPAVSMAIRKLENEVGSALFDRSNRSGFQLTAVGEVLFTHAKRLLALRDEALASVKELQNLDAGHIRIGANESAGNYLLPQLIHIFRKQHPKVRVDVLRQNSRQLIADIRDDLVDVALISFQPEERDIEAIPVMKDELILIAGPKHPLSKGRKVRIQDLGAASFIAHTVTSMSRHKVVEAFRSTDTPLHIVMEVAMIETIKKLVEMGLGVAFVPAMSVRDEIRRKQLVRVPIEEFRYERTVYLARRRTDAHSHAAQEFAAVVKASFPLGR